MSNLLNIKDQNGNWIPIPVITNGIQSITQNQDYTLTITLNDGTTYTTTSIKGDKGDKGETGATGNGIASAVLNADYTLTITLTDGTEYTTGSIRGEQGEAGSDATATDVQIDGTSITADGVANIPIATSSQAGVAIIEPTNGIGIESQHKLYINCAPSDLIKSGVGNYRPISPPRQHESVFYGLAKAAGDTTQALSSNAVGTYTDSAKTAIKQMLDVKDDYDSLIVEVSGTDPVITGKPSYRYNCGELYTLNITPPASGTMDIIFTSGATPTVLTLPNAVKMPDWWAGIETNTTYEMCITDGTYCGVMSWAI